MIKLTNNRTLTYGGNIFITNNVYDVIRYIDGRDDDVRILYDQSINTWFMGEAGEYTHANFVMEGWKNGLYYDYDFKTEDDVAYYYGNGSFLYLYYYKTTPFRPNLTGDYEMHYVYDFGILDSHDIIEGQALNYEDTELYKVLLPRLITTKKELTTIMEK